MHIYLLGVKFKKVHLIFISSHKNIKPVVLAVFYLKHVFWDIQIYLHLFNFYFDFLFKLLWY